MSLIKMDEEVSKIIQSLGQRSGHSVDMAVVKLIKLKESIREEDERRKEFEKKVLDKCLTK